MMVAMGRLVPMTLFSGVTISGDGFEQIFAGPVVVYFATSTVTVNVGTVARPTGAGLPHGGRRRP